MTEAKVHRIHAPQFSDPEFPPMPPRIRLAISCWERVWWLTLSEPIESLEPVHSILKDFSSDTVILRAQMRTYRKICIAINSRDLDEQAEFELTMSLMARINREVSTIDRVQDRLASRWPITQF